LEAGKGIELTLSVSMQYLKRPADQGIEIAHIRHRMMSEVWTRIPHDLYEALGHSHLA
jgi:hypothetical protein